MQRGTAPLAPFPHRHAYVLTAGGRRSSAVRHSPSGDLASGSQRAIEVGEEVGQRLDADGETHECGIDGER